MRSPQPAPIRVLIADGDPRVGRALGRLLHDAVEVEVVATATDGPAILEYGRRLQPAVAIVDAGTARFDGLALTRSLCQQTPAARVVVLSVYATLRDPAFAAGACRFLLKDCSRAELVAAIRGAARGQCQPARDGLDESLGAD
jgi:DNA-binding NarL/FixJ family response regulator